MGGSSKPQPTTGLNPLVPEDVGRPSGWTEGLTVVFALLRRLGLLRQPRVQPGRGLGVVAADRQTDGRTERGSVSEDDGGREEEVGGTLAEERRTSETPEIKEENEKRVNEKRVRLAKRNQFLLA